MQEEEFSELLQEESEPELVQYKIDPGQTPVRLDHFLSEKIAKVSRNKIQSAIESELVTVNGKKSKSNYKIRGNDLIEFYIPKPPSTSELIPEDQNLDVIYEDDDLLVINKKQGVVVHPAAGVYTGTLLNGLAWHLGYRQKEILTDGNERLGLVHRIDKETSGLLLVAKNEHSVSHLSKQFFHHTIDREYLALVWGEPDPAIGTITANIYRDPKRRSCMGVSKDGLEGKHAVTHYELVESFYYTSLVRCKLETGRTHQIRVHMRHIGHTLFNDEKYGGDQILKGTLFTKYKQFIQNCNKILPHFALHARSIGFIHPNTGKKMYFEQELPENFKNLVDKWRHYTAHRKEILDDGKFEFED
ncbi:MAG TPA: RluA family pseudouridine synthase [Saprospiraceae bacterium]|nr:RluA family pseudouridine synthase [Saprospiraceae bacterium]